MTRVVIVESPAKSKTINKYLGADYKVLASFGHIRDLPSKDGSVEPDADFAMHYEISPDSTKHVKAISDAMKSADTLILATDPDREGEAISWHVLEMLKSKKALKKDTKIERVVFNSITKKSVLDAMENPRQIDMDLVNAQQARRALDYLVGFTLSPVLWRKLPGSRSAGRVQSVALRAICERENEIEAFKSQEYWDIKVALANTAGTDFTARLTHYNGEKLEKFSLNTESKALDAAKALESKSFAVASIEAKQTKRNPFAPFTTSTLQQEAFRKLGFGAKRTMQIAQKLYEGIELGGETTGLITYMRTDGIYVAPEAIMSAREMIGKEFGKEYVPNSPRMYQNKSASAQEAHEAIRPTDPTRSPRMVQKYLDQDQFRLYELVWKRMVASQMESAVLDQVTADIESSDGKAILRASGSTIKFDGFLTLYIESREDDEAEADDSRMLPALAKGENVKTRQVLPAQHFTEPPPRYSEASLVKKLEELGIGRPSTYASIISVLQDREYVKLDKKRFVPEPRGRVVTAFLTDFFRRYVEYDFTAKLETELDEVAEGQLDWKKLLHQFWKDFSATADSAKQLQITEVIQRLNEALSHYLFPGEGEIEERRKCPHCAEGKLSLKMGKFGAFLGCSNYPECKFTKQLEGQASEAVEEGAMANIVAEPKVLGEHEGKQLTVRKGPYGFYVQWGDEEKPKRTSIPKPRDPVALTLEEAIGLISLPRNLGTHPDTGKVVKAGLGRFGPYLLHDTKYTSLKGDDDVLTIGINRAVALIAESAKGGKKEAKALKDLGPHPDDKKQVSVYDGRYGPYVKHGKTNATLPKDMAPEDMTLEAALELLAKKATKKKKK